MDKSTDSTNTTGNRGSGSGETPPQTCENISLGCGPSATAATAAGNGSGTTTPNASTAAQAAAITASSPHANRSNAMKTSGSAAAVTNGGASSLPLPLCPGLPFMPHAATATAAQLQAATTHLSHINLNISTTTGGNFGVQVDPQISVENLKKIIAKKLKVAKDRICLLHREKELQDGTLKGNNLMDGSKIILIPNVETGLLAQRPENTVMQALESLNDSQVNDFLSGKTPLNLSMRLGDHMMLIQLQLSTVNPANANTALAGSSCSASRTRSSQRSSARSSTSASTAALAAHSHHHHHHHHHHANMAAMAAGGGGGGGGSGSVAGTGTDARKMDVDAPRPSISNRVPVGPTTSIAQALGGGASKDIKRDLSSFLGKHDYESFQNIIKNIALAQSSRLAASHNAASKSLGATVAAAAAAAACPAIAGIASGSNIQTLRSVSTATSAGSGFQAAAESALLEQSPIKSLSNLVSSPIKTTAIKNIPIANGGSSSSSSSSSCTNATATSSTNNNSNNSLVSAAAAGVVGAASTSSIAASCHDPIAAKLTSCLCTRLNGNTNNAVASKGCMDSVCLSRHDTVENNTTTNTSITSSTTTVQTTRTTTTTTVLTSTPNFKAGVASSVAASLLHKTANNPITRSKHRHHHHHHHHHHHYHHHAATSTTGSNAQGITSPTTRSKLPIAARCASVASNDSGIAMDDSSLGASTAATSFISPTATVSSSSASTVDLDDSAITVSDTRTLAEASRNLTQTLRKLSKEVFTNKIDLASGDETLRKSGSGAVIESMKNHGKGIYSGTFSGTLNPALQDRYGRPKRDISTVIHILNDLLSATPQYSRGARISFETPSTSAAAAAANGAANAHGVRNKQQLSSKHHSCVKCIKNHAHNHSPSSSMVCTYGECNGHYANKSQGGITKTTYGCCQDLTVGSNGNGIGSSAGNAISNAANERNICSCRYRVVGESGDREREHTCQKCLVDMDNLKTKSKLDQLRLVMQQRKQKREARKLKGAPYGARVVGAAAATASDGVGGVADVATASLAAAATTTPLASATSMAAPPPSEVSPNHIVEEVDTAA